MGRALSASKTKIRDAFVILIGEFVGTFSFLFLTFTVIQTANQPAAKQQNDGINELKIIYIAAAAGASLAVNVWVFFRVSGGAFNPAVTLGLALVGAISPVLALLVAIVQVAAAYAAALTVQFIIPGEAVLFAVSLGPGVTQIQGLALEAVLTSFLMFTVLMLAAEKTKSTFLAALGIGLIIFVDHLVGVNWTGAGMNPARSLGSALVLRTFPNQWLYWLGPIIGSTFAVGLYKLLKYLDYASVGGDADRTPEEAFINSGEASRLETLIRTLVPKIGSDERPPRLRLYRMSGMSEYTVDMEKGKERIGHDENS